MQQTVGVAIVDQGIRHDHFRLKGVDVEEVEICLENDFQIDDTLLDDTKLSHATNLANIILRIMPGVKLLSVKLVASKKPNVLLLCKALQYCSSRDDIRVINISLGILKKYPNDELKKCCDLCRRKGKLMVAAAHYDQDLKCYPAAFPTVYGVGAGLAKNLDDYEWLGKGYINVLAKGIHQRLIGEKKEAIIMNGTSYAAAAFSGILAKMLEKTPRYILRDEFEAMLAENSKKMISTHYRCENRKLQTAPLSGSFDGKSKSSCLLFPTDDFKVERFTITKELSCMIMKYPLNPGNRFDGQFCKRYKCIDGLLSVKILQHVDGLVVGNFMKNPYLINIYFGFAVLKLFLQNDRNILLLDSRLMSVIEDLLTVENINFKGDVYVKRSLRHNAASELEKSF